MRRRRLRRRLAVSTVVANMLMITITLALGAVLVAWAGTSYGGFTGGSQPYYLQRQQALGEQFAIENVFLTCVPTPPCAPPTCGALGCIYIFVRDVGATVVGIVAVYVDEIPETPTGSYDNIVPSSGNIGSCTFPTSASSTNPSAAFFLAPFTTGTTSPGSMCSQTPPYPNIVDFTVQINTDLNGHCPTLPWCTGDIMYITVASANGNQVTYTVGAP